MDSRPISCARGISKQIIALYKSYLRSATSEKCDAKIVDPFLCLNIACPLGSYDVNVEPAKDDLLFINADPILQMAEHCFKKVYGELGPSSPKLSADRSLDTPRGIGLLLARDRPAAEANAQNPPSLARSIACNSSSTIRSATRDPHFPITSDNETFSTAEKPYQEDIQAPQGFTNSGYSPPILEGTLPETSSSMLPSPPSLTRSENTDEELNEAAFATKNSAWRKSMYPDEYEDDDLEEYHDTRPETPINIELDECNGLRDVQVSNPWAFAKINAPFRPPARQHCGDVAGKGQLPTPGRQVGDIDLSADLSSDDLLQEGRAQTLLPAVPLPLKARGKRKTDEAFPNPAETNEQRYGRGSLDTWVQKSFSDYPKLDDRGSISPSNLGPPCLPRSLGFVSARTLQQGGIPLGSIPDMSQKPPRKAAPRKQKQGHIDKPFISPVNDPERVWFDTDETPQQKQRQQTQPRKELQNTAAAAAAALMLRDDEDSEAIIPRSLLPPLEQTPNDVAAAMDFEARKRKWVLERKKSLRQEPAAQKRNPAAADPADATLILEPPATKTARASPHKNRQAAAIKALHPRPDPIIASPTHEDMPADPRPPTAEPRPQIERSKRRKSALLPLETLHKDAYVGDLSLMLKTTAADIAAAMEEGWAWDGYIQYGEVGDAFGALSALEVAELEARIGALVRGSFAAVDGARGVGVVDFDLRKILRAHAADVGFD